MCVYVGRFVKDGVNFGLNTDDSGIIDTDLTRECSEAVNKYGMTRDQVIQSMFNSAKSAFIPDEEKKLLITKLSHLMEQYTN